jgi:hypothetical protein
MKDIRSNHPHNEASAIAAIHDHSLLAAFEWDLAFWIVSDEKPARKAVAALGRVRTVSGVSCRCGRPSPPAQTPGPPRIARR